MDDLELLFDPVNQVIHVRSAARTGTYDWGVNARRVERIRADFTNRLRERRPAAAPAA